MRIVVDAIFDGVQWQWGTDRGYRRKDAVDVITTERPKVGDTVEGKLVDIIDPDSYEARRIIAADTFGGEAYLCVGMRTPPGRPT